MAIKLPFLTAEPFIFLCTASLTLNTVTLPQLILENICKRDYNVTVCLNIHEPKFKTEQDAVQQHTVLWILIFLSIITSICVLTVPVLGPFADVIGKRRAMFLTPVLLSVQSTGYLILSALDYPFHPSLLLLPVPVCALAGDLFGMFLFSTSYIADITTDENRTFRITVLGAFHSSGNCLATFASGFLLQAYGYKGGYITTLILEALAIIYLAFFLPDSKTEPPATAVGKETEETPVLEQENTNNCTADSDDNQNKLIISGSGQQRPSVGAKIKFVLSQSNPIKNFKKLIAVLKNQDQWKIVTSLIAALFVSMLSWVGEVSIMVLYIKNRPLNFDAVDVGYFLAAQSLACAVFGNLLINFILQRCFHFHDLVVTTLALFLHAIYLLLVGLATSKLMIYSIQLICGLAALDTPTIRSSLTKRIDPSSHGTMLATSGMLEALASVVASFLGTAVYAGMVKWYPGATFFALAAFPFFGSLITAVLFWKEKRHPEKPAQSLLVEDTKCKLLPETAKLDCTDKTTTM